LTARKPKPDPDLARREQLAADVDELGALDKELAPFAAKVKRVEALRKAVRAAFADAPADEPCVATGQRFVIELGPRGEERAIHYPELWKLGGVKLMRQIATCTLTALDAAAPAIAAAVTFKARTGHRSLKVTERSAP
jgi:hypothetical protein